MPIATIGSGDWGGGVACPRDVRGHQQICGDSGTWKVNHQPPFPHLRDREDCTYFRGNLRTTLVNLQDGLARALLIVISSHVTGCYAMNEAKGLGGNE